MSKSDDKHFEEYRQQNEVKHRILTRYLPSYFNVIKGTHQRILVVDGFAGRGHYGEVVEEQAAGSPIRTLQLISKNEDFRSRVLPIFIEKDPTHCAQLEASVTSFLKFNKGLQEPIIQNGEFSKVLRSLLQHADQTGGELAPTFLFVDPCGVEDVAMEVIADVLRRPVCEVFIFFNLDGVRRIAGLLKNHRHGPTLRELLGSESRVDDLAHELEPIENPNQKEQALVRAYIRALKESGAAQYVIPFRVEFENRRSTSHYLIHASKHHLGFKIMKEVMWDAGRDGDGEGRLELLQASRGDLSALMRVDLAQADEAICECLREHGPQRVALFRSDWPVRPDDFFTSSCYRRRLLDLEAKGKIVVLQEDGQTPYPPTARRPYKGEPTLAEKLFVRLA